jgi:hypothetical protein
MARRAFLRMAAGSRPLPPRIVNRMTGKANRAVIRNEMTLSTQPPKYPARSPSMIPILITVRDRVRH